MTERLKYEGHLALLKQDVMQLKIALNGLLKAMRDNLDPLEKIEKLDGALVAQQALEFAGKQIVLKEKLEEIVKAEEILGREHKPTWP